MVFVVVLVLFGVVVVVALLFGVGTAGVHSNKNRPRLCASNTSSPLGEMARNSGGIAFTLNAHVSPYSVYTAVPIRGVVV